MMNGLKVRFCFNSINFSTKVGKGCEHFKPFLAHESHDFVSSLWRFKSSNSRDTVSFETQPRSQRSDFSASSVRFFERSHCGVSGTKQIAIAQITGTAKHIDATLLHGNSVFKRSPIKPPIVPRMFAYPIKIPLTEGWLQNIKWNLFTCAKFFFDIFVKTHCFVPNFTKINADLNS